MRYLSPRGNSFQFERSVPKDIRHIIGFDKWRESLFTDSRREAERRCQTRTVETNAIIQQAREGTLRHFTDEQIDNLAIRWSTEFQLAHEASIAHELFPQHVPEGAPISDSAPSSIFASRKKLEAAVAEWAAIHDDVPEQGSSDWIKLIDECLDEYLVSNPALPGDWKGVLKDRGFDDQALEQRSVQIVKRPHKVDERKRLSSLYRDFCKNPGSIDKGTIEEYYIGVRRFIDLHGDMDATQITRSHAEQFRNALRQLPSRPPNAVRKLPLQEQVQWGENHEKKKIGQAAINKNILGVKRTLEYGFWETAAFEDRSWHNPFDGFSKKPGKAKDPVRPFTDTQLETIFSRQNFKTKSVEKFWIPVLLLYTGARLDEVSPLHVNDVKLEPVPHILCENLEDEDPALAKKLKTESSHRTIPLHQDLIDIGFLKYVDAVREQGERLLFPDLRHGKADGRGDSVSRDFIRRFRKIGADYPSSDLNSKSLVTHSLRHSFRTRALFLLDQLFVMIVMGHYVAGESIQTYGKEAYLMPDLLHLKVMQDIRVPEIDLDYLREEAERYLSQLQD